MSTYALAVNREGQAIIPGPYLPSTGVCQWCGQELVMHGDDYRSTAPGGSSRCRPEDRGATCVWGFYREQGIDPLTLKGHDGACNCQVSICHVPRSGSTPAYPYPDRIPYHCGQPARLTEDGWVCRGRDGWTVAAGPEVVPGA